MAVAFLFATSVPLFFLAFTLTVSARDSMRRAGYERNAAVAGMVADYVGQYLSDAEGVLDELASRRELRRATQSADIGALHRTLTEVQSRHSEFEALFVVGVEGAILHVDREENAGLAQAFVDRGDAAKAADAQSFYVSDAYQEPATGTPVIAVSTVIRGDSGQSLGSLVGALSLREFVRNLDAIRAGGAGWVTVLDQRGTVIADSDPNMLMHPASDAGPAVAAALTVVSGQREQESVHGGRALVTYLPADDSNWRIVVQEPSTIAFAGSTTLFWWSIVYFLASLSIAFVAVSLLSTTLTRPLRRLQTAVSTIGSGDLQERISIRTGDEIEDLAETFNQMSDQLRERMGELAQALDVAHRERLKAEMATAVAADGVIVIDEERRIASVNPAFERLSGYRAEELVGKACRQLLGMELRDHRCFCEQNCPFLNPPAQATAALEAATRTKDGALVWLAVTYGVIPGPDGSVKGVVLNMRDVSGQKEVQRLKDEFLSTVSHELRTPLTAILGYGDMLLRGMRGPLTARQEEAQHSIRSNALRLLTLINDLLDVARLESGELTLSRRRVSVAGAVEKAVSSVAILASARTIDLQCRVPDDLPPISADEDKLQQILYNLLSNAIKFTPEGGKVTVEALSRPAESVPPEETRGPRVEQVLEIRVTDTGIGLTADQLPRIWARFYQGDSSPSRQFSGAGLGLSIVKQLVELHGGRVWAESAGEGRGSTFAFTVALDTGESEHSSRVQELRRRPPHERRATTWTAGGGEPGR